MYLSTILLYLSERICLDSHKTILIYYFHSHFRFLYKFILPHLHIQQR